jgi:hypothetical protein
VARLSRTEDMLQLRGGLVVILPDTLGIGV